MTDNFLGVEELSDYELRELDRIEVEMERGNKRSLSEIEWTKTTELALSYTLKRHDFYKINYINIRRNIKKRYHI